GGASRCRAGCPRPRASRSASSASQALAAVSPKVTLTTDPTQDRTDRYGRLLAYVAPAAGGESFQARLVAGGWALVYRFNKTHPPQRAGQYDHLASRARAADRGVWRLCGGFHKRLAR
ncbi:MAG: thermonuclease family protein, partial [Patulibacter sp.]|nr:thermonuclease family protein [Patulibacter sp.]